MGLIFGGRISIVVSMSTGEQGKKKREREVYMSSRAWVGAVGRLLRGRRGPVGGELAVAALVRKHGGRVLWRSRRKSIKGSETGGWAGQSGARAEERRMVGGSKKRGQVCSNDNSVCWLVAHTHKTTRMRTAAPPLRLGGGDEDDDDGNKLGGLGWWYTDLTD